MSDEEVLHLFRESKALLEGHFKLRSGLHSNQFFQCALLTQYPKIASRLCELLVNKISSIIEINDIDTVIAPAMGGITLGHDVARVMDKRFIFLEKVDGKLKLRRFEISSSEKFLIIEDVVTKGGRVQETIDIVKSYKGILAGVGILVDRSNVNIDFGVPLVSLLNINPKVYEPNNIPLWLQKIPLTIPGSK